MNAITKILFLFLCMGLGACGDGFEAMNSGQRNFNSSQEPGQLQIDTIRLGEIEFPDRVPLFVPQSRQAL